MASGEILRVREVSHRLLRSIARQKRMTIGDRDFYHRSLRWLVAIELKLGSFDPAHKGQMELYLRWRDRYERWPGEEPPI